MPYTLNFQSAVCQLHLNKTEFNRNKNKNNYMLFTRNTFKICEF